MFRTMCIALVALAAAASPAVAQLPHLTGPVRDAVDDVVSQPLPEPAEQVVEQSPAAPVRNEVRRLVNETTGGGPGVSASGGNGSGANAAGSGGSAGSGAGAGDPNGSSGTATRPPGAGRRGERGRAGNRVTPVTRAARLAA